MLSKHQSEIALFFLLVTFMYHVPQLFITIASNPLGKLILLLVVVYSFKLFGLYNGILVTLIVIMIFEHSSILEGMENQEEEEEDKKVEEEELDAIVAEENQEDQLEVEEELSRKNNSNDVDVNKPLEEETGTSSEPVGNLEEGLENIGPIDN